MPIYYRNQKTGKIEGKYVGCDTRSERYYDKTPHYFDDDPAKGIESYSYKLKKELYKRFESEEDLPLEVEPTPIPIEYPTEITLKSPDGSAWTIEIDNMGKIKTKKKKGKAKELRSKWE